MNTRSRNIQTGKHTIRQDGHTALNEETASAPVNTQRGGHSAAAGRVIQVTEEQLQSLLVDAIAKYAAQHQQNNIPHAALQGAGTNAHLVQGTEQLPGTSARRDPQIPQAGEEGPHQTRRWYGTSPVERSPFSARVLSEALPVGFKVPNLLEYDGTGDPQDHVDLYLSKMELHCATDAITCRAFRTTLTKKAQTWFSQLPSGSVNTFEQLSARFLRHFVSNRRSPKTANHLFTVVQGERETLRDYVHRFTSELLEVPHVNEELLSSIILRGLQRGRFKSSLAGKPSATLDELLARAEKYIRIEEMIGAEAIAAGKRKGEEEIRESLKKQRDDNRRARSPPRRFNHYERITDRKANQ